MFIIFKEAGFHYLELPGGHLTDYKVDAPHQLTRLPGDILPSNFNSYIDWIDQLYFEEIMSFS